MAEVIDLTKYLQKKEEREIEILSSKLADLMEEMGVTNDFEMYMEDFGEMYPLPGMPYVYTMYSSPYCQKDFTDSNEVSSLSDITDVLTRLTLQLDEMGYTKWADQISNVVGEMFVSGTFEKRK